MSKYISISIPQPCSQNWDDMTANHEGRFCNSCQKTVVDFTAMSDTQVLNFINSNADKTCGIFYENQLEKQMLVPRKPLPWLKYFFTITLPAFLLSQKANAQKIIEKNKIEITKSNKSAVEPLEKKDTVQNLDTVVVRSYATNRIGGKIMTRCGTQSTLMGSVYSKASIIKVEDKKHTSVNEITIYPNPIASNTRMNINWVNPVYNNQQIEIFNAVGVLMQKEIIALNTKTNSSSFMLHQLIKGFYIIRITDVKTQAKMSKEFILL
jgi:Secretion system C-terminal sorting domain